MAVPSQPGPTPVTAVRGRSAVHRLESRQAQSLFREINEQISLISEDQRDRDELDLVCECTNPSCFATFPIEAKAYDSVRLFPTRFIVRPGHVSVESERIAEKTSDYVVVENFGPSAHSAIRLNPRRRLAAAGGPATSRGWNVSALRL